MSALDKITPMFLANAAFCIENGSEVKPETRESIIDTLIKASEELSQANDAKCDPTPSITYEMMAEKLSNDGYSRQAEHIRMIIKNQRAASAPRENT
jgi:hypothetical protein